MPNIPMYESALTYEIIGILYKVHNKLGSLHPEKVYQKALETEFTLRNLAYQKELPVNIMYEDQKLGQYKVDFLIEDKVILETKATKAIPAKFVDQTLKYMNQLQTRIGLLANFGTDRMWIKRLLLPDKYLK